MNQRDVRHVFESLRKGLVPERGLEAYAVGVERSRVEIARQLDLAQDGEGTIKFLRGGYGCGKTFLGRLAVLDAQQRGFATSFVVVSDNDLKFYKFDDVYRKVVSELGTASCSRGALGDVLDRWIGKIEESIHIAHVSSIKIDTNLLFSDVLIETTGGHHPIVCHGHTKGDAIKMKQLVEKLQSERYAKKI